MSMDDASWLTLIAQRKTIKALLDSGDRSALPVLADVAGNHHQDQHCRIMAIEGMEKLTGRDIMALVEDYPVLNCKFVRRFADRQAKKRAEQDAA